MIELIQPPAPNAEKGKPIFFEYVEDKVIWLNSNKIVSYDPKYGNA